MTASPNELWHRLNEYFLRYEDLGISLDVSRMKFPREYISNLQPKIEQAFAAMKELESGAIANPDEGRQVGHYWLRAPELAPSDELRKEIIGPRDGIRDFAARVRNGEIHAEGQPFTDAVIVGIGGSALGPQLTDDALRSHADCLKLHYLDNTDPDGIDRLLSEIEPRLATTMVVVISKSGGTKETRNGMLEMEQAYKMRNLAFAPRAVAVTGPGSQLDQYAESHGWRARFPMSDWVGGRTSVMSSVGLLPMELQGLNTGNFLAGAAAMDEKTRQNNLWDNAAMLLAVMWHYAGNGRGEKDMVVLPYKDRLVLFSKYLQQLVMESLGKEKDLDGNVVNQGIAVYGNKGSTDQHAYVQQLREGVNNFFVVFIEVRKDRHTASFEVEEGVTSGDYLQGFLRGTRAALYENNRESVTISLPRMDAFNLGALIALFERAVGFYATLVNVNAYHQPGVEAGKKAATRLLELQKQVIEVLQATSGESLTADDVAWRIGERGGSASAEDVYHTLVHLSENRTSFTADYSSDGTPKNDRFKYLPVT